MAKLEIEIFDDEWPKLRLVGTIRHNNGQATHFGDKVQWDQAYLKFEGVLHNMLRPLITNVVERRKNPSRFLGIANQESTEPQT